MRVLDAHQHFWSLGEPGHEWPTAEWPTVHRDFGPRDLREATAGVALAGTVLIQSQPTDHDTDWMLALADAEPLVKAVVGWVDLADTSAPARVAALATRPKLRGLRPMLQGIADTDWLLRAELAPALGAMKDHGLRLDALVQPRHLPMLATFAALWPRLPIVIDHAAKPLAATGGLDPWRDDIARLADLGLYCKLSGLRTEQALSQPVDDLAPYVTHLVACFGERLMWGSDWPVIALAGDSWADWLRDASTLAADADPADLFAGCATRFYDLAL
jgi:L-fuconolactonase